MNFLGVGPSEFFFILLLGLVVVGPERLIEFARFLGRSVARLLAWQQQSPEAQLVQQIRQEIEDEIKGLRNELMTTQQQLNSNVQSFKQSMPSLSLDTSATNTATNNPNNNSPQTKQPVQARGRANRNNRDNRDNQHRSRGQEEPLTASSTSSAPATQPQDLSNASSEQYLKHLLEQEPVATDDPSQQPSMNGRDATGAETPSANTTIAPGENLLPQENHAYPVSPISATDIEMLQQQIQALMMDMHALQIYLRTHGYIDSEWAPPSHTMHHETKPS